MGNGRRQSCLYPQKSDLVNSWELCVPTDSHDADTTPDKGVIVDSGDPAQDSNRYQRCPFNGADSWYTGSVHRQTLIQPVRNPSSVIDVTKLLRVGGLGIRNRGTISFGVGMLVSGLGIATYSIRSGGYLRNRTIPCPRGS